MQLDRPKPQSVASRWTSKLVPISVQATANPLLVAIPPSAETRVDFCMLRTGPWPYLHCACTRTVHGTTKRLRETCLSWQSLASGQKHSEPKTAGFDLPFVSRHFIVSDGAEYFLNSRTFAVVTCTSSEIANTVQDFCFAFHVLELFWPNDY